MSQGVLPQLLRELYVGRKTGILYFLKGEERRGVRLRKGHIVRAHTNVPEERLGETLVRLGRLSAEDFARASEVVVRDGKRLGAVLMELGILDKHGLEDALADHVHEILLKVFPLSEGSYSFEDQDPDAPLDEEITLRLSTGEMILEAVRQVQDPDVVRYALGDQDRVLSLSTDPLLRFQRLNLSPGDGYVLSRVDGTLSAREVIQLIPMVPEEVERSLFALLCTGVIEYLPGPPKKPAPRPVAPAPPRAAAPEPLPNASRVAPPAAPGPPVPPAAATPAARPAPPPPVPPPAAAAATAAPAKVVHEDAVARRKEVVDAYEGLGKRNHFEVLEIPKASSEAQVKEAYFRLAKRFHPDTHHDPALADLKDKIEAVFIRLGTAYDVLRNPRTRSSYEADLASRTPRVIPTASTPEAPPPKDPDAEARLAEESARKAEKYYAAEKYWDAIQLLEPAIPKLAARVKQKARVTLARCYLKNPNWVKQGEAVLRTVTQEDPKNVEALFLLGTIYKGGGLKSRAHSMFRKVLELKPDHEEASAELVGLAPEESEPRPEEGGGGLLKKLFGKG